MGMSFFDNQKIDYIGDLSVKLQYTLIIMHVILTIDLILLILLAALALGFILPLPFTFLMWLAIPVGFLGCWRRGHVLLLIYICSGALSMFLLMLGMAILVLIIADVATACGAKNNCKIGRKFIMPTILVYIIASICVILGGIVLAVGIRTFPRFWKLRQKLVREMRGEKAVKPKKKKKKEKDESEDGGSDGEEEELY